MNMKKVLAMCVTTGLVAGLMGSSAVTVMADDVKVLTLAQHNSKESTNGQATQVFVDYVNEHSNTIQIEPYYNGELGGIQEAVEGVVMGTIDITHSSFAQLSSLHQDMEIFSIPYLVKNGEDNKKLMDVDNDPVLQEILGAFEEASGLTCIGTSASYEARQLTCNFEVKKPEDLEGHKIRSITNDVYTLAVEGLGGTPVPIDWTETPTALSTGTVEGQENPYSTLVSYQLWDCQKYVMETNHIYDSSVGIINNALWDTLSEEDHQVLKDAQKAMADWSYNTQKDNQEEYKQTCKDNGMTIITVEDGLDIDAFKARTDELKSEKYAKYQDYFDRLDEYLGY